MKVSGFWALFLLAGAALILFFNFSSLIGGYLFPPDLFATNYPAKTTLIAVSRKLKENDSGIRRKYKAGLGRVSLNDYGRYDPAPSSKVRVSPGPIEHGTPLIPYIPKPPPPPDNY